MSKNLSQLLNFNNIQNNNKLSKLAKKASQQLIKTANFAEHLINSLRNK